MSELKIDFEERWTLGKKAQVAWWSENIELAYINIWVVLKVLVVMRWP